MSAFPRLVRAAMANILGGATLSPTPVVEQGYVTYRQEADLGPAPIVSVLTPPALRSEPLTRTGDRSEVVATIVLQARPADTTAASLDPLLDLADQVYALFPRGRLAGLPEAIVVEREWPVVADADHLHGMGVLTSIMTFTVRSPA